MKRRSISTAAAILVPVCALVLAVLTSSGSFAQGAPGGSGDRIEGKYKFLPIPYVNYDRSIGLQGGFLPMLMFNPADSDTISPSSMAGLFGMYTTNETWFANAFTKLFLDEDNWRITAAGGIGNYNFQFYMDAPIAAWIPYNTEMIIGYAQVQRRIYKTLYGGVSYVYLDFETTLEPLPDNPERTIRHGLGFDLELDSRTSVYYPRGGFLSTLKYFTFPTAFGNESSADKLDFEYNHYLPFRDDKDVIAGRFFAGIGLGELPFEQQYIVGQRKDIRGYTQGEYRGNYMFALQGEYRWNFHKRLGLVGFAGVATVFDAVNEDEDGKLLPGIGTGFRFTADMETNMNVGMDIAAGLGDWGIYFKFGEQF